MNETEYERKFADWLKELTPKYDTSFGSQVTQQTINRNLSNTYKRIHQQTQLIKCGAYPLLKADDHDHTISQQRCKQLHQADLIWHQSNIEFSSRKAHQEWESYKSGLFQRHANVIKRMAFVRYHDPETYEKRLQYITNQRIIDILNG